MTLSARMIERLRHIAAIGSMLTMLVAMIGMLVPARILPQDLPPDLLLHAVGFGIPATLAAFAAVTRRWLMLAMVLIAAASVGTELVQSVIPGRSVSLHDVLADGVGIGIGCSLGKLLQGLLLAPFQPNPAKALNPEAASGTSRIVRAPALRHAPRRSSDPRQG